jgi:galactose-6-phosphate isomerase
MADIDVTEILFDPDFSDEICLIDRVPTVDGFGRNILTEVKFDTVGCIQPASGKVIQRLPEDLRVANMSSFWLHAKIIATAPGKYSSVLVFRGTRYLVQTVFDWSNFGEGFTEGICVAEVPA